MARSWILPISGLYVVAVATGILLTTLLVRWRQQRNQQQRAERPTLPSLPAVLPAYLFDHSESAPTDENGNALTYCLSCWLRDVARGGGPWAIPAGIPQFCALHAYTTLARALEARAQQDQQNNQQQTGDRSL
jgi:hypothetical protein